MSAADLFLFSALLVSVVSLVSAAELPSVGGVRRIWRASVRRNKASPGGTPAVGFGARIGYWPCKRGPFVQIAFLFWRLDLWHGLPSVQQLSEGE